MFSVYIILKLRGLFLFVCVFGLFVFLLENTKEARLIYFTESFNNKIIFDVK